MGGGGLEEWAMGPWHHLAPPLPYQRQQEVADPNPEEQEVEDSEGGNVVARGGKVDAAGLGGLWTPRWDEESVRADYSNELNRMKVDYRRLEGG